MVEIAESLDELTQSDATSLIENMLRARSVPNGRYRCANLAGNEASAKVR
jgi:hypothetical protein